VLRDLVPAGRERLDSRRWSGELRAARPTYHLEWRRANPEKARSYFDRYRAKRQTPGSLEYWLVKVRNDERNRLRLSLRAAAMGFTVLDKLDIWFEQGFKCAIGGEPLPFNRAQLDHDHDSGNVRGVVCQRHNLILGRIESAEARAAIAYLDKWGKRFP
jgi:Recombination endonuclease VII